MGSKTPAQRHRVSVRATTEDDLELVLELERKPENSKFIWQWTEKQHREAMADSSTAHWIIQAQPDQRTIGYLILRGIGSPNRSLEFLRIVITEKGSGYGRETLQLVKQQAFERLGTHRLWLDVMAHNDRARHLYRSEGFLEEGTLRECMLVENEFVSLVVMSMLEGEYWKGKQSITFCASSH